MPTWKQIKFQYHFEPFDTSSANDSFAYDSRKFCSVHTCLFQGKAIFNNTSSRSLCKNEEIEDETVKVDFSNINSKSAENFKILFLEIKFNFEISLTCEIVLLAPIVFKSDFLQFSNCILHSIIFTSSLN